MKMKMLLLLAIGLALGCENRTDPPTAQEMDDRPFVIMVSIDGFRHDYAEKFEATNILSMRESGAWAEAMVPSFPSKTFPNHYSLVTGMYPGTHGIVGNKFYSKAKDAYYSIGEKSVLDGSWYGGTPLWVLAEQNDMRAASYFWVGSEAEIKGVRPSKYEAYDGRVSNASRVNEVLAWLALPKAERPQFITLYFSDVDSRGHSTGPDSDQTGDAVRSIDSNIGVLREGIAKSGLNVTLIITSDHGMATINEPYFLDVDWRGAKTVFSSTNVSVFGSNQEEIDAIKSDIAAIEKVKVYSRDEFPETYHFENADRSGDLLVTIDPPAVFSTSESINGGTHGFDPYVHTDMHTIFYAEGPRIKSNFAIESFENVHVFPLVATILGLPVPEDIDGDLEVLDKILKE